VPGVGISVRHMSDLRDVSTYGRVALGLGLAALTGAYTYLVWERFARRKKVIVREDGSTEVENEIQSPAERVPEEPLHETSVPPKGPQPVMRQFESSDDMRIARVPSLTDFVLCDYDPTECDDSKEDGDWTWVDARTSREARR
jgi:hypothetical protein